MTTALPVDKKVAMTSLTETTPMQPVSPENTDHAALEQHARELRRREDLAREQNTRHRETWGDGPPYFSVATFDFWQQLAHDRFHLARCGKCSHVYFPPRVVCPECWGQDAVQLQETSGLGRLVSFTDLHVTSPTLKSIAPLRMALIDLDEGVRVLTWLRGSAAANASVGQGCRIAVEEVLGRKWFVATLVA
jgi:uncharacterized OB-fold protein